jgi:hypothetical protein
VGCIVNINTQLWPNKTILFDFDAAFDQYRPPFDISASVGEGGSNLSDDVELIQQYLNRFPASDGGPSPQLVVDGCIGPLTIAAIRQFQMAHLGWQDGRVDPSGPTLIELTIDDVDSTATDDSGAKGIILNAVHEWNKQLAGRPRWVRRRWLDLSYVNFKPGDSNKSDTLGKGRLRQNVKINIARAKSLIQQVGNSGTPKGVVIHEMGHAAGLQHEHQRSDRDKNVTIQWANIADDRRCDFLIPPNDQGCWSRPAQQPQTPRLTFADDGPYDFVSTMHYFPTQGGKTQGLVTITSNSGMRPMGSLSGLSAGDKATLLKFYK